MAPTTTYIGWIIKERIIYIIFTTTTTSTMRHSLKRLNYILNIHLKNSCLEKVFDLNLSSRPKDKILVDLHYYALKFAFANSFSKIQISSFVSILRALHRANQGLFYSYIYIHIYIISSLVFCC